MDDIPTPPYSPPATRPTSFIRRDSNQGVLTPASVPLVHRENSSLSLAHGSGNASLRTRLSDNDSSEQNLASGSPLRPQFSREGSDLQSSSSSLVDPLAFREEEHIAESSHNSARSQSRGRARVTPTSLSNGPSPGSSRAASLSAAPHSPMVPIRPQFHSPNSSASNSNSILAAHPHMADSEGRTPSNSPNRERGRRHTRFSLMSVSNALLDAVKERVRSNSRTKDGHRSPAASRDHSPEANGGTSRGASRRRDPSPTTERGRQASRAEDSKRKEKSTLGRIGDALGLDMEGGAGEHEGWKEFRKGE